MLPHQLGRVKHGSLILRYAQDDRGRYGSTVILLRLCGDCAIEYLKELCEMLYNTALRA